MIKIVAIGYLINIIGLIIAVKCMTKDQGDIEGMGRAMARGAAIIPYSYVALGLMFAWIEIKERYGKGK